MTRCRAASSRCLSVATVLACQGIALSATAQDAEERFFSKRTLDPTQEEAEALRALQTNRPLGPSTKPVIGSDSSVRFVYGASLPIIVCAPLQVCDVELQPGEQVRSVQVGDAIRWSVEPAVTGKAPHEVQHLIIKPADVGIRTSIVVTTDRRTYRMKLTSDRDRYILSAADAAGLFDLEVRARLSLRLRLPFSCSSSSA